MFDFDPDYDHEKYKKTKFSEADEQRDNPSFIAWDLLINMQLTETHAELNNICERVRAGDRNSMLDLIEVTADTLLVFDSLSPELRANFYDGLKEVVNVLRLSKGFLTRGRGELSNEGSQAYQRSADLTAMRVEYCRKQHRLSIDEAQGKVAEDFGISESLVHKHYKRNKAYLGARLVFEALDCVYEICGVAVSPTRCKKVR